MKRCALIVMICAGTAGAQTTARGRAADRTAAPVALMQCGHPEYTEEARVAHLTGLVTMSLTVDDDGVPTDIHVLSPLGLGLDESAVACVSQSRYSPAVKAGKPVPFKLNVSLEFQQHWDSEWHLGTAAFRTAVGGARPVLLKADFPANSGDRRSLSVCLHLTIDANGKPRAMQVTAPRDPMMAKQAIAIVGGWCFKPGTLQGRPVEVPATLTLVHGSNGGGRADGNREPL